MFILCIFLIKFIQFNAHSFPYSNTQAIGS